MNRKQSIAKMTFCQYLQEVQCEQNGRTIYVETVNLQDPDKANYSNTDYDEMKQNETINPSTVNNMISEYQKIQNAIKQKKLGKEGNMESNLELAIEYEAKLLENSRKIAKIRKKRQ